MMRVDVMLLSPLLVWSVSHACLLAGNPQGIITRVPGAAISTRSDSVQASPEAGRKLYPGDDSSSDPAFAAFKASLLDAAKRGDLNALRNAMAPTVQAGFEPATPDQAIQNLQEGMPWRALVTALSLGAVRARYFDEDGFAAPYTVVAGLQEHDLAVVAADVNVRERPAADAPIVEKLSYDVVSTPGDARWARSEEVAPALTNADDWAPVVTPSGKRGYVFGQLVMSPFATQFWFTRVGGAWKIVGFARGD